MKTTGKNSHEGQAGETKSEERQQGRVGKNVTVDEKIVEHKG